MTYDDKPWLKWYDDGVRSEPSIPDTTFIQEIVQVAERFPERPAVHFLGVTLTFRELLALSDRFAQALLDYGCKPGDVVGVGLPNIPQYLIALLGTLRAGCASSGVSPLLTTRELAYQLNDCNAKALVTLDAIFENRLMRVADTIPHLDAVFVTGILDFLSPVKRFLGKLLKKVPTGKVFRIPGKDVVRFMSLLDRYPPVPPAVTIASEDHALVQYTGGTTGLPKGTLLTHRNLVANMTQVLSWLQTDRGTEVLLSGFPLFHLAGLAIGGVSLAMGGAQVLIPNPRDTRHIVKETAKYRPSILVNVPSLYMLLTEDPGFRKLDFSHLNFCISGASPFPAESIRELESVIGEGKVIEVYGMTESSPIITMNPRFGRKKIGSVGIPVAGTKVRIADLDTGDVPAPVDNEGELIACGPQVMKGYLNKPEETAIALRDHDGEVWLHTGDVARMDEDGFFYIVDRAKDMLNVGGFKVFSREVEEKLYEHPAIELCAVIGVPNPDRPGSEIVKVVVQLTPDYRLKPEDIVRQDIIEHARMNCSPYKVPKIVEFSDEMPLTAVGKVDKKALR